MNLCGTSENALLRQKSCGSLKTRAGWWSDTRGARCALKGEIAKWGKVVKDAASRRVKIGQTKFPKVGLSASMLGMRERGLVPIFVLSWLYEADS